MKEEEFVISKQRIIAFLLFILVTYCILFPADKLNIKEILLFIVLFFGYFKDTIQVSKKVIYFGLLFPLFEIAYALVRGVSIGSAISFGYVWLYVLLIPIIHNSKFDFKKCFIIATYIVALIIDFIMLTDLFNLIPFDNNFLANYFYNIGEIQGLGKGLASTIGYSIFYKSCPLIIASYAYFIYKKRYIMSAPLLLALLASGTRANFLIAILITGVVTVLSFNDAKKRKIALMIIGLGAICFLPFVYNKISDLNKIKKVGSDVKMSDTNRAIAELNKNPINWLLGTGVGSSFVSVRGNDLATYEISIIDFTRQSGLIGAGVFIVFIGLIIKKCIRDKRIWLIIALISYLGVACTNPLLVTSTSFMLYLFVICYKENEDVKISTEKCGE